MDRTVRIAAEMQRVISEIIRNDLKDPRIPLMTSVMSIKLAKDLKYAKVFVSVFGDEHQKQQALLALKNSAGYIRREIGQRMIIRALPELTFTLDESLERGAYMSKLIDEVVKTDEDNVE